jgi:hypothetical protein
MADGDRDKYQPLLKGSYSTRGKINPATQALLSDWTGDSEEDQIAETYREGVWLDARGRARTDSGEIVEDVAAALDAGEKLKPEGKLAIDYKTVAQCCLLNYYKDNRDLHPQFIQIRQEFADFIKSISKYVVTDGESGSDIDSEQGVDTGKVLVISKDLLRKTFINAIELFDTVLHLVPKATRMGMTQDIVLYSGIRTYKGIIGCDLFSRRVGETFVLPTFTATSVSKNTAYRFAKADPEAGEDMRANKKRIMRIVIPSEKLESFPFCYLSEHAGTIENYITNKQKAWSGELEILLAPGMKLELVSVELDVPTEYSHPRGDRASSSSEEQTASSGSEEGDSDQSVEPREHTSFTMEQITVDIYTLKFVDVPTDAEIGDFKSEMKSTFELLEPFLEEEAAAEQGKKKKPKTDGGRRRKSRKRKSRKRKSRKRKSRKRKSRKRKSRKRKSRKRKSRKRLRKRKSRQTRKKR